MLKRLQIGLPQGKDERVELLAWAIALGVLFYHLHPLFSSRALAGWDLTPHYYLFELFISYLKEGRLSGYDPNWYGGYPAFSLYAPFAYLVLGLPHLLTFGAISSQFSFNVMLFFVPCAALFAFRELSRVFFGASPKVSIAALLFGLLFLTADREFAHLGVGVPAELYVGLVPNFVGLTFFLFFLLTLERFNQSGKRSVFCWSVALLSCVILSHTLTAVFAFWILFCAWCCARRGRKIPIVGIGLLAVIATAWWWVPFSEHLWLSSGEPLGLNNIYPDPLFALYPGFNPGRFKDLSAGLWRMSQISMTGLGQFELPTIFYDFPFAGILLCLCSIYGLCALIKEQRYFIPVAFLTSLVLLPRDFFSKTIDLALHYYRFIQPLFFLSILMAVYGLLRLSERLSEINHRPLKRGLELILATFILSSVLTSSILRFNLMHPFVEPFGKEMPGNFDYHIYQDEYRDYKKAVEMMEFIAQQPDSLRVAIEAPVKSMILLGSPHFFSAMLPLRYGRAVVPGLLAESAVSSGFITPTLRRGSDQLMWGRISLARHSEFNSQPVESMMERLALYNVGYVLATTRVYSTTLNEVAKLKLIKRVGEFALYKISTPRPRIECSNYRPFLFVDEGGFDFRAFSEEWFTRPELLDHPVIYSRLAYEDLPESERQQIAGVIVSLPKDYSLSTIERWKQSGKKIIFLNAAPSATFAETDSIKFIKRFGFGFGVDELERLLLDYSPAPAQRSEVKPTLFEAEKVNFTATCPAIVNYSYAPRWRDATKAKTVYMVTPALMFIFAEGETQLAYGR